MTVSTKYVGGIELCIIHKGFGENTKVIPLTFQINLNFFKKKK